VVLRSAYTPSSLVLDARLLLEGGLGLVSISGEISNFVRASSGHLYFSLKDSGAQVRCAMFKLRAGYLRVKPDNGMLVTARARVTLYEPRGEFQLVIESLEDAGAGLLKQRLEALRLQLQSEGLFDAARKRALPAFPVHLAVVTSATGAAIRDVLSVLERRFPSLQVTIYPAQVQGVQAPAELLAAFNSALRAGHHDVILLTRGGGSAEDLSAFNDEALTRAVAGSLIPTVSAVGHEIDFTLVDFAADVRAPTPSAAAELIAPERAVLLRGLTERQLRLLRAWEQLGERLQQRLDLAALKLQAQHPLAQIARDRAGLQTLRARLRDPREKLNRARERAARLNVALRALLQSTLLSGRQRQRVAIARLDALSPLATLKRGYSILLDEQQLAVTDARTLKPDQLLQAVLAEGRIGLRVSQ